MSRPMIAVLASNGTHVVCHESNKMTEIGYMHKLEYWYFTKYKPIAIFVDGEHVGGAATATNIPHPSEFRGREEYFEEYDEIGWVEGPKSLPVRGEYTPLTMAHTLHQLTKLIKGESTSDYKVPEQKISSLDYLMQTHGFKSMTNIFPDNAREHNTTFDDKDVALLSTRIMLTINYLRLQFLDSCNGFPGRLHRPAVNAVYELVDVSSVHTSFVNVIHRKYPDGLTDDLLKLECQKFLHLIYTVKLPQILDGLCDDV